LVFGTRTEPGTSGSNGGLMSARPVIESAPIDVPWCVVKKTRLRSAGARFARRSASSMAFGWA
jgi:hypothetical protein